MDDQKEQTEEQKVNSHEDQTQEILDSVVQQSILAKYLGKRTLEKVRRQWYKHHSPKALKKKKVRRQLTKRSRRQNKNQSRKK